MLVRPLLTVGRHQTLQLCQRLGLPIWEDSTNSDNRQVGLPIRKEDRDRQGMASEF